MLLLFFHSILIHFNFFCSLSLSISSSLDFCCFYLFQLIIGLCSFSLVIDLNMFRDDPPSIHLKLESIFERLVMKSEAGGFKNPIISSRIFFNVWMRPQQKMKHWEISPNEVEIKSLNWWQMVDYAKTSSENKSCGEIFYFYKMSIIIKLIFSRYHFTHPFFFASNFYPSDVSN